eukprot:10399187-Alexandrium_andersonii.AAC.1
MHHPQTRHHPQPARPECKEGKGRARPCSAAVGATALQCLTVDRRLRSGRVGDEHTRRWTSGEKHGA